jgi:hypothetical protein
MDYKIFVLCPDKSNRSSRWDWSNPKLYRELGFWRNDLELIDKLPNYKFLPTCHLRTKLPRMACSEGHFNMLRKIVKEKLTNIFILDYDSVIDYSKIDKFLEDIKDIDGLIYTGGAFNYSKVKDWSSRKPHISEYMKDKPIEGINEVTKDIWVCGTFGYFIKDYKIAEHILGNCKGKTGKYLSSLTDVMLNKIPNLNRYYYYPSLVECAINTTSSNISIKDPHFGKSFKNYKH